LISLFEHANAIKYKLESGKVRQNRVRKPYGWDSIELEGCNVVQGQCELDDKGLTMESRLKYRPTKRENTTKDPMRNDTLRLGVNSSPDMLYQTLGGK
jgi:hypothetical protein